MLFKMVDLKWEDKTQRIKLDTLYISVNTRTRVDNLDQAKMYDACESTAVEYIARYLPEIEQYASDKEWFEHQLPLQPLPELIGEARGVITHCIEQMQELLLTLPESTDWKQESLVKMTKWQIERAAETVRKLHFGNYYKV
jgi:hypothetical protein